MMRKFELIKEYPGSLEKGAIVTTCLGNNIYYEVTVDSIKHYYSLSIIENHPEYWREKVEVVCDQKPYEFLTRDNQICVEGDIIYGIALQASGIDMIRKQVLPFKTAAGQSRVWFKDFNIARRYLHDNAQKLSIEDVDYLLNISEETRKQLYILVQTRIN